MKPRIRELARADDRLIGVLAVEILLALYNPRDQGKEYVLELVPSSDVPRFRPARY